MEHKNEITCEIYAESRDIEQLSLLETHLWDNADSKKIAEIFKWKYPASSPIKNGFVAYDGDKLVGFRGFFINNYTDGAEVFPVAILGDAVVHPEYQRRGIFSKLTLSAIEYFKSTDLRYILALSSNEKSSGGNIKMGWVPFAHKIRGARPVFCNILPIKKIFRSYIDKKILKNNYTVDSHDTISAATARELEEYCKSKNTTNKIRLYKDRNFWEYRYACPNYKYTTFILRKNNGICGYITVSNSIGASNGIAHTKILDYCANDAAALKLLIKKTEISTKNKIILISLASINPDLSRTVSRMFPVKQPSRNGNVSDKYLVKKINEENSAELPEFILNYVDIDSM